VKLASNQQSMTPHCLLSARVPRLACRDRAADHPDRQGSGVFCLQDPGDRAAGADAGRNRGERRDDEDRDWHDGEQLLAVVEPSNREDDRRITSAAVPASSG